MASSAEIADLYLTLRASTAPLMEGFEAGQATAEEFATSITAATAEVTASVERMAEGVRAATGAADEAMLAQQAEYAKLVEQTLAVNAKFEAQQVKTAESTAAVGDAMAASSPKVAQYGRIATGVTLAAAAIGVGSVKMAADFQSSTNRLVTSAGEIQSNIAGVRNGMLDMAGQVGDSAEQLSAGMYTVESASFHGADGLTVLRAAAEGAKAENADLSVVANGVTDVLTDYHLKASDAATVTSQLVTAVGQGKTTFQDLSASLHSVLPLASSLHIAFTDVAAAEAEMTSHGMSADQAAQNLADTMKHLASPTGVQITEMNQLGISVQGVQAMLSQKGLTGTVEYLSETILSKMGPSGKVLLDSFKQSKDAANDLNAMLAKMPPKLQDLAKGYESGKITLASWREDLKGLPADQANLLTQFAALANRAHGFNDQLKAGGPAAQLYTTALQKTMGDATGLNTALMLTGENTAATNANVKAIAGATAEAGNHVKGWASIQNTFNQRLAESKASLETLAIRIGNALLPVAQQLMGVISSLVGWLDKHKTAAKVLGDAIGVIVGLFVLYKAGALAAAAADGVSTMAKNTAKAAELAWSGVKKASIALDWAGVAATKAKQAALLVWMGIQKASVVSDWAAAAAMKAREIATAAWLGITKAAAAATKLWTAAQVALDAAMDANPVGLIIIAIVAVIAVIVLLWTHSAAFRNFFIAVWHAIWDALKAIGAWFAGPFVNFFKRAWDLLVAGLKAYANVWKAIWNDVWGFIKGVGHWFSDTLPNFFKKAWDLIIAGVRAYANFWLSIWGDIWSFIKGIGNWFSSTLPNFFVNAWHAIENAVRNIYNSIKNAFTNAFNEAKSLAEKFLDVGRDIVMGIVHGVENAGGALFSSLKNLASNALNAAKSFLHIGSPSKLFADEVGQWIPHGIAAGINGAAQVAKDAVNTLAAGLLPASLGSVAVAGGGGVAAPIGASVASQMVAAVTANTTTAGGGQTIVVQVDGKKLFQIMVPYAQQNKLRNTSTFMT